MMDFDRARRKAEERSEREFGAPTRGIFSLDASLIYASLIMHAHTISSK